MKASSKLEEASAYQYLGLHEEAWEVLQRADVRERSSTEGLRLQAEVLQSLENWPQAAELARHALVNDPLTAEFYIMGAYAIRRSESLENAYRFLAAGAAACREDATWHFNMACYESQMGRFDTIPARLTTAIESEPRFRKLIETDPDLQPWRTFRDRSEEAG